MTSRACVIGWPVSHSRSPAIHGYWLEQHGIDGQYGKVAVEPGHLVDFIKRVRDGVYAGCNLTVPHKEQVLKHVDKVHRAASEIGAANTLWMEGGVLHATNTDAHGFLANLDEGAPGWDSDARSALLLGAGGAARAVIYALQERGFKTLHLVNRTRSRADELAGEFGAGIQVHDWNARDELCESVNLVVNTTTLGMTSSPPLKLDLGKADPETVVTDLVYAPLSTPLLQQAKEKNLRSVDGLGMLLHQAVPGFEKWFGVRPEVTAELRALVVADLEQN